MVVVAVVPGQVMVSVTSTPGDARLAHVLDAVAVQVIPDAVAQRRRRAVVAEVGAVMVAPPLTVTVYGSVWL